MKVYLVYSESYEDLLKKTGARVLVNYAEPKQSKLGRIIPFGFESVIIDSGVFQLQMKVKTGWELTRSAYCFWLQQELPQHPEVEGYLAFDWDGGKGTSAERQALIRENYEYMRSEGLDPIPVWHPTRETLDDLEYYASKTDYIAMGGIASTGRFSQAGPILASATMRYPGVKFHVLGLGHSLINNLFAKFLPYSLDISTWNVPARFGNVLTLNNKGKIVERHLAGYQKGGRKKKAEEFLGGRSEVLDKALLDSINLLSSMENYEDMGVKGQQLLMI